MGSLGPMVCPVPPDPGGRESNGEGTQRPKLSPFFARVEALALSLHTPTPKERESAGRAAAAIAGGLWWAALTPMSREDVWGRNNRPKGEGASAV